MRLSEAEAGDELVLTAVDAEPARRRRLAELGLRPGARVHLLHRSAGGARLVLLGGSRMAVGRSLLQRITVSAEAGTPVQDRHVADASSPVSRVNPSPSSRSRGCGCGDPSDGAAFDRTTPDTSASAPAPALVALVGPPNVGKSSLFNALTGARRQVGNWPGTTVEVGRGAWRGPSPAAGGVDGPPVTLVDLPGTCSLDPASPDEALTRALLLEPPPVQRPDLALALVSAADPARGLYLLAQLLQHLLGPDASVRDEQLRLVVVLTLDDVARRRGSWLDAPTLRDLTGLPVVVVDPRHRRGLDELAREVTAALADGGLAADAAHAVPTLPLAAPLAALLAPAPGESEPARLDALFTWVAAVLETATRHDIRRATRNDTRRDGRPAATGTPTDRLDRVLTSPGLGSLAFLAVMWGVFQVTTSVAAPMVDALDRLVAGPVTGATSAALDAVGAGGTWFAGLVLDGVLAGVGTVLTFVPLMALMFVLLAVLEDSGYLARAAVVADRAMRVVGLPGRAFVPLLVGYGCNVPAVAATRVLPDARHRVLTAMLVPFATCPARLPVYVLIGAAMFGAHAGTLVFGMYVASIGLIVGGGWLLRRTVFRGLRPDPLFIDLPDYQLPVPRMVAAVTWTRLRAFLRTAAGMIVVTVCAVWLLSAVPARPGADGFGQVAVEDSAFAATSRVIAPVFAPAGFGDWHTAGALVVGFVAKEAVISSWAQTYAAGEPDDLREPGRLGVAVRADFTASSGGHPRAAGLAFLLFVLGYAPCVATLTAQVREIGRRRALAALGFSLMTCWLVAVLVFQTGRLLG